MKKTLAADNSIYGDKLKENENLKNISNFMKFDIVSKQSSLEKSLNQLAELQESEQKLKSTVNI